MQSDLIRLTWLLPATDLLGRFFAYHLPNNRRAKAKGIPELLDTATLTEVTRPRFEALATC